jgi:hypothetical protein
VEGLLVKSPYAANIADLDGGGRRRRKSSGSVLDANAVILRPAWLADGEEVPKLDELTFGELPIDSSDLGKTTFLRANGSRSFLRIGGVPIEAKAKEG